jgi:hypothetical protein
LGRRRRNRPRRSPCKPSDQRQRRSNRCGSSLTTSRRVNCWQRSTRDARPHWPSSSAAGRARTRDGLAEWCGRRSHVITERGRSWWRHARRAALRGASVTGHAGWCHIELGRSGRLLAARDGDRLLQAWDRWDRHRHARPCAGPLLRRLRVSAWAGEAEDQVLQHARGPRGLLDGGRGPGAVVRLGLDH